MKVYSVKEATKKLKEFGITHSEQQVRIWIREKKLEALKPPHGIRKLGYRITEEQLSKFISSRSAEWDQLQSVQKIIPLAKNDPIELVNRIEELENELLWQLKLLQEYKKENSILKKQIEQIKQNSPIKTLFQEEMGIHDIQTSNILHQIVKIQMNRLLFNCEKKVGIIPANHPYLELPKFRGVQLYDCDSVNNAHFHLLCLEPGAEVPEHTHSGYELHLVVEGNVLALLEGKRIPAKTGELFHFPSCKAHGCKNSGDQPATILSVTFSSLEELKWKESSQVCNSPRR